uniref:PORR domain-containing protein n=1 Tax=Cannabis sativa TaxID=3483 RepID=A0A803QF66_CANSA
MIRWFLFTKVGTSNFLCKSQSGFSYQQKFSLVNVKLKWVKDATLDDVVTFDKDLKAASTLVTLISSSPQRKLPIYHLVCHRGQLGLPIDLKLSTFIRRYPSIFLESHVLDTGGTRVPCFSLTREAQELRDEELHVFELNQSDLLSRLRKLFMLTRNLSLPLQTIDQLRWDFGLPYDYRLTFIPRHLDMFSFVKLPDKRDGLKHKIWDDELAVSELVRNSASQQIEEDMKSGCLAFPIGFTRGFGLKRKCMEWLKEWQSLPYTSPYIDASHLDPRTDVSEKRVVGVFHELLHLTLQKKTERKNVSNLRKPLALPQKFTRAFERHPGIFYISKKCDTQTVILREAYDGGKLLHRHRHPLLEIREKFAGMLREGLLDRSKGLYKKSRRVVVEEDDPTKHGSRLEFDIDTHEYYSSKLLDDKIGKMTIR